MSAAKLLMPGATGSCVQFLAPEKRKRSRGKGGENFPAQSLAHFLEQARLSKFTHLRARPRAHDECAGYNRRNRLNTARAVLENMDEPAALSFYRWDQNA